MAYSVPPNFPLDPVSGYVEPVQQMQDGVDAAREANEIRERIAREIGRTAVTGSSQQG